MSNVGVAYRWKDLKAGFSITSWNSQTFKHNGIIYNAARHYWLFADYTWNLSENFALQPAALLRTNAIKMSSMFTLRGVINRQYWAGIT